MITDLDLAQACLDTYNDAAAWDNKWTIDTVNVYLRRVEQGAIIAFEGSNSEEDWLRDFQAWPRKHPLLGYCHSGFLQGADAVYTALAKVVDGSFAITGHSLGAAEALICAGLFSAHGRPPTKILTFGTPRPGMARLSNILNTSGAFIKHYRNGPDPVADVPLSIAPLWLYQKPVMDTPLYVAPADDAHDPFHWHHMPLYFSGVKAQV